MQTKNEQLKQANATIKRQTAVLEALVERVERPLWHSTKYPPTCPRKYGYQRPITALLYQQAKAALKGGGT